MFSDKKAHTIRVMLLGETGSGKSTLINYLANYFLHGDLNVENKYESVKIVIPNKLFPRITDKIGENNENNVKDQTQSQTNKPSVYKFVDPNNYNLNVEIIDTPGLADTRKASQDDENIVQILRKASELEYLSAIVLIINGSHARKTTTLRYVLNKLEGTVPDSLLKNLIVVLTNCDENSCNFEMKLLNGLKPQQVFYMQNNAFSGTNREKSDKAWQKLEREWKQSMKTLKKVIQCVSEFNNVSANDFKKMMLARQDLLRYANEIIIKQTKIFQVIEILERREQDLKKQDELAEQNKNFKQKKKIKVWELEKVDYFSTVCQTHFKEKICHEKCGLAYNPDKDRAHFVNCWAHGGQGNCKSCECSMGDHYHTYEIPRERDSTTEIILNEMKAVYDEAIRKKNGFVNEVQTNKALKDALLTEIYNLKQSLIKICYDLKKICQNFNFHEELHTFIENLRKEASISHNFKLQKEFNDTANAIESLLESDDFAIKVNMVQVDDDEDDDGQSETGGEYESSNENTKDQSDVASDASDLD